MKNAFVFYLFVVVFFTFFDIWLKDLNDQTNGRSYWIGLIIKTLMTFLLIFKDVY